MTSSSRGDSGSNAGCVCILASVWCHNSFLAIIQSNKHKKSHLWNFTFYFQSANYERFLAQRLVPLRTTLRVHSFCKLLLFPVTLYFLPSTNIVALTLLAIDCFSIQVSIWVWQFVYKTPVDSYIMLLLLWERSSSDILSSKDNVSKRRQCDAHTFLLILSFEILQFVLECHLWRSFSTKTF